MPGSVEQVRTTQLWTGSEGLARLRRTGECTVPDPSGFRADWHAIQADGVQLAEWRSTPLTLAAGDEQPGAMRIDAVIGGRVRYRIGEAAHDAEPGSVHFVRAGRGVALSSDSGVRIARVSLSDQAVPLWLRDRAPIADGPLPSTVLTAGFVALLDRLTAALRDDDELPLTTAKAVGALAGALLEEAVPAVALEERDLRRLMVAFVDRHLGDGDLGPRRLADEFGISLRWVHRVFNQDDQSIARYIRERRVDAIAQQLRSDRRSARIGDLAFRFGFAGRDQLTRAFKQRYGCTVGEYLDLVLRDRRLPEPDRRRCSDAGGR